MKNILTSSAFLFLVLCSTVVSAHNCIHDQLEYAPIRMQVAPEDAAIEDFYDYGNWYPTTTATRRPTYTPTYAPYTPTYTSAYIPTYTRPLYTTTTYTRPGYTTTYTRPVYTPTTTYNTYTTTYTRPATTYTSTYVPTSYTKPTATSPVWPTSTATVKPTTSPLKTYQTLRITPEYTGIAHLGAAQQRFVKDILMPRALEQLTSIFSIIRESDTIYFTESTCGSARVPSQYFRRALDTDLMIFVVAEKKDPGILAAAAACFLHPTTDRPIGGAVYLNTVNLFTEYETWQGQIETMVHELLHVLGFSRSLFPFYRIRGGLVTKDAIKRGAQTKIVVTPRVVAVAKQYYSCPTVDGVELENEGDLGSRGSHWERRTLGDEAMTASDVSYPKLSIFTLALLEDSGWYKANYANAEQLTFGRGRGCDFLEKSCIDKVTKQPRFPEFCGVDRQVSCSLDHMEIGTCLINYRSDLPSAFNYFGNGNSGWDRFADGCPTLLPSRENDCTKNASKVTGTKGMSSRCFDVAHWSTFDKQQCMVHKCKYNADKTATLTVEYEGQTYECPQAGGNVYIPNKIKTMTVSCPVAEKVCTEGIRMSAYEDEKAGTIQYALHHIYEILEDIFGFSK